MGNFYIMQEENSFEFSPFYFSYIKIKKKNLFIK